MIVYCGDFVFDSLFRFLNECDLLGWAGCCELCFISGHVDSFFRGLYGYICLINIIWGLKLIFIITIYNIQYTIYIEYTIYSVHSDIDIHTVYIDDIDILKNIDIILS